jgi:hypothetical protein
MFCNLLWIVKEGDKSFQVVSLLLKSKLDRRLEDSRRLSARDPAEAARGIVHVRRRIVEARMIENIEVLKSKSHRQGVMKRKAAAQRQIDIEELGGPRRHSCPDFHRCLEHSR